MRTLKNTWDAYTWGFQWRIMGVIAGSKFNPMTTKMCGKYAKLIERQKKAITRGHMKWIQAYAFAAQFCREAYETIEGTLVNREGVLQYAKQ